MPRLLPLGEAAWTVEFGAAIDPALHARVLGFARHVEAAGLPGVTEVVPTFRSCTVYFDPLRCHGEELAARLRALACEASTEVVRGRRWRIPVLFGGEAGPDLPRLARHAGLDEAATVARLTACVFRVYLLGFLPGFAYMGGLPAAFALPRRATPRPRVPARSVAVAGPLAAIYPTASPGGWHLIGRTPVQPFDAADIAAPALFAPGDEVMWQAVDAATYAALEQDPPPRSRLLVAPEGPWPA